MDTVVVALRVALSLGVVLALLWVLQKRFSKGLKSGRATSPVTVVTRQGIGTKASVVVVDVEGERLVLGVTDSSITVLAAADVPVAQPTLELVPSPASTPAPEARVTALAPVTPQPAPVAHPTVAHPPVPPTGPAPADPFAATLAAVQTDRSDAFVQSSAESSTRSDTSLGMGAAEMGAAEWVPPGWVPPRPRCCARAAPRAAPRRPVRDAGPPRPPTATATTAAAPAPAGRRRRSRARSSRPTRGVRPPPRSAADEPDDRVRLRAASARAADRPIRPDREPRLRDRRAPCLLGCRLAIDRPPRHLRRPDA